MTDLLAILAAHNITANVIDGAVYAVLDWTRRNPVSGKLEGGSDIVKVTRENVAEILGY